MQLQQRINAFTKLGTFLSEWSQDTDNAALLQAKAQNGWFTPDNLQFALESWGKALQQTNLESWTANYSFSENTASKTIAIVMAGNIPLVGFHDFLSVLMSGHKVLAKLSSNDRVLLPYLAKELITIEPAFASYIRFTEDKLEGFDAVIATGSNNTARYFDYYFGKYPNIIRKNRNSVAVLTGNESKAQMEALAGDVFQYFGLGCRNVSKVYLPEDYDFDAFFNGMYAWKEIIYNDKYINNYDYNKAVYLMSDVSLLDNEFMLLKEDTQFSSPISVVFYERYKDLDHLKDHLSENQENIQCIVGQTGWEGEIPFGEAQSPKLWDYADGVDTLKFLLEL
ncbi:acyl-CoA reductase [Aureisphaera galaxeae]|uniref:acyl-CoA reductase n=1 Tax=Aureisphaera galaxeae TaxID=1538023 RepID=UPI00235086BF|nr:acyl-CoA reductase [Aureisphaera galaxeae]MDC8003988.1 acyl-CoA reductase [Aureisphaera galaxeae]